MCIVPGLERSKFFTTALVNFNQDNPGFLEEMKQDPNKEALLDIGGQLTPMNWLEIEARKQEIINASKDAIILFPKESKLIIDRELSFLDA
ncbi:MAG: hypothetical protein JXA43_02585 [Candidatus Diapherotrites archaeon]|nr:hypothetical protein [Candidatus Diapherotrites archaeon]